MKKTPIVMKTWAGDEPHDMDYITRSLPSLLASDLPDNIELFIYDDCSPNKQLRTYLESLQKRDNRVKVCFSEINRGPNWAQEQVYAMIQEEYPDAPYYINVDDDVVYHHNWLREMVTALDNCHSIGLNTVITALDMPYRQAFSTLRFGTKKYSLKWKQPALNWLIPKTLYSDVGPFKDEGIAYDTVYSHWMRLKHHPIVCISPSFVQNIGLKGAYARDDTTTASDFIGEGQGYGLTERTVNSLKYTINRIPEKTKRLMDSAARRIAPIRWGTEFLFEGTNDSNQTLAMFSFEEYERLGWTREDACKRVEQVLLAQTDHPCAIHAIRRSMRDTPTWVECKWKFLPNLREIRKLQLSDKKPDASLLFRSILTNLAPLHQAGIVHNKIRQENIYCDDNAYYLAWFGAEITANQKISTNTSETTNLLSSALNRWAKPATKEQCAVAYIESLAPEQLLGDKITPAADIYAAAATTLLALCPELTSYSDFLRVRDQWNQGIFENLSLIEDEKVRTAISNCLNVPPENRPCDASAVLNKLLS